MQVIVDGLLVNYTRTGKGRPVILLHGWGDSAAGLRKLAQDLSKCFEVVALDLPGFGGSQSPPVPWSLDDYGLLLSNFLQKIELKPYAVIGHSNGGAIAIRSLAKGLVTASKLVLLASAGIRGEYKGRNHAWRLVAKVGKAASYPLPKAVKNKLRKQLYATVGSDMLVAEHLQETFKRVVTDDVRADAQQLKLPTLLIYGDQDASTPVRYGKLLHESIAGSQLQIIQNAGHFVHIDDDKQVSTLIEEFLA